MTHFTVGIIVPPNIRNLKAYIAGQMAPFDEKLRFAGNTANPIARWDRYRIGGRWDGWIMGNPQSSDNRFNFGKRNQTLRNNTVTTEAAFVSGRIPHAIVTPDGEWHEHGYMGGFAVMANEPDRWNKVAREILRNHRCHRIVILDAHI